LLAAWSSSSRIETRGMVVTPFKVGTRAGKGLCGPAALVVTGW